MNPQSQGNVNLQGGNISVQGSNYNPQPAANISQASPSSQNINITPSSQLINNGTNAVNSANSALAAGNAQSDQIASLLKTIQAETKANAPGVAPSLNLNSINAQSQAAANKSVNPLYTQYLNQYLQQEAANTQSAQSQNQLNLQGEQTELSNTLANNQLQEKAATSSNELQQGNINVQQQNYELQSGNAQNAKLSAIGSAIGSGNLGASGLGQQQLYAAENARNTADAAQRGGFQYQRDQGNLSTQDTFAQLAQSSQQATTGEGHAEAQTNFNLNDYLRQAAYNDSQYRQANEASRQEAITAQTGQFQAQEIQRQLQAANPTGSKNYAAGEQAYSNLLSPGLSLPSAPSQNNYLTAAGNTV